MSDFSTGIVKWFNDEKGYGFIAPDSGDTDLFIHYKSIQGTGRRTLIEGQKVQFKKEEGEKGMQAVEVSVVE